MQTEQTQEKNSKVDQILRESVPTNTSGFKGSIYEESVSDKSFSNEMRCDSSQKNEEADQILRESVQINKNDFNTYEENTGDKGIPNEILKNANNYFLLKILSPEIRDNEKKKRDHKDFLIKVVKIFLIGQFIILGLLLFGIIGAFIVFHALGNDLSIEDLKLVIHFVSLYITSVVVELIAMLNYIISRVFDTSITGLVELYKDKESYSKEESNKDK